MGNGRQCRRQIIIVQNSNTTKFITPTIERRFGAQLRRKVDLFSSETVWPFARGMPFGMLRWSIRFILVFENGVRKQISSTNRRWHLLPFAFGINCFKATIRHTRNWMRLHRLKGKRFYFCRADATFATFIVIRLFFAENENQNVTFVGSRILRAHTLTATRWNEWKWKGSQFMNISSPRRQGCGE